MLQANGCGRSEQGHNWSKFLRSLQAYLSRTEKMSVSSQSCRACNQWQKYANFSDTCKDGYQMNGRPVSYQRQPMRKNPAALPITSPRYLCSFAARILPTPSVDLRVCERLSMHGDSTPLTSVHVLIKCYLLHSLQKHSSNLFVQINSCRRSVYCSLSRQWYRYFHVAIGIPSRSSGPLHCRCGIDWKSSWRRLYQSQC